MSSASGRQAPRPSIPKLALAGLQQPARPAFSHAGSSNTAGHGLHHSPLHSPGSAQQHPACGAHGAARQHHHHPGSPALSVAGSITGPQRPAAQAPPAPAAAPAAAQQSPQDPVASLVLRRAAAEQLLGSSTPRSAAAALQAAQAAMAKADAMLGRSSASKPRQPLSARGPGPQLHPQPHDSSRLLWQSSSNLRLSTAHGAFSFSTAAAAAAPASSDAPALPSYHSQPLPALQYTDARQRSQPLPRPVSSTGAAAAFHLPASSTRTSASILSDRQSASPEPFFGQQRQQGGRPRQPAQQQGLVQAARTDSPDNDVLDWEEIQRAANAASELVSTTPRGALQSAAAAAQQQQWQQQEVQEVQQMAPAAAGPRPGTLTPQSAHWQQRSFPEPQALFATPSLSAGSVAPPGAQGGCVTSPGISLAAGAAAGDMPPLGDLNSLECTPMAQAPSAAPAVQAPGTLDLAALKQRFSALQARH
jgi:hypothetical protein